MGLDLYFRLAEGDRGGLERWSWGLNLPPRHPSTGSLRLGALTCRCAAPPHAGPVQFHAAASGSIWVLPRTQVPPFCA
eukprot:13549906-Alexandrium_andersonii.AAC.1